MRFIRLLFSNSSFRSTFRFLSAQSKNIPFVRVVTVLDEDSIKLSFSNSSTLTIKAPKDQDVSSLLSVIRLKFALHRKRQEMRQAVIRKYSNATHAAVEITEEIEDVCLLDDNKLIDERTPNIEAWSQASLLKIGDASFEVQFNTPIVKNMSLPDYILCGCLIRPHFILECAVLEDCVFTWYRLINNSIHHEDSTTMEWIEVFKGFNYLVAKDDAGCYLKVVCHPNGGSDFVCISNNTVETVTEVFPFEERQAYTKTVCGNDRQV